jgi:hypothetical protein
MYPASRVDIAIFQSCKSYRASRQLGFCGPPQTAVGLLDSVRRRLKLGAKRFARSKLPKIFVAHLVSFDTFPRPWQTGFNPKSFKFCDRKEKRNQKARVARQVAGVGYVRRDSGPSHG